MKIQFFFVRDGNGNFNLKFEFSTSYINLQDFIIYSNINLSYRLLIINRLLNSLRC